MSLFRDLVSANCSVTLSVSPHGRHHQHDQRGTATGPVLAHLTRGDLTIEEAAELLDVSVRHAWRLRAGFLVEGPAALAHGNRGRPSPRRIDEATRAKVVALAGSVAYKGANDTFLAELFAEHEGIGCPPQPRRILRAAGRASPKQRRAPRHRSRRERMPRAGMLVQVDGSPTTGSRAADPGSRSWAASTMPPVPRGSHLPGRGGQRRLPATAPRHRPRSRAARGHLP